MEQQTKIFIWLFWTVIIFQCILGLCGVYFTDTLFIDDNYSVNLWD